MAVMVLVTVVALNALIALLGDSFANVLDTAQSKRNRQRAMLLKEYLTVLGTCRRRKIETACRFTHQLMPVSQVRKRNICWRDSFIPFPALKHLLARFIHLVSRPDTLPAGACCAV